MDASVDLEADTPVANDVEAGDALAADSIQLTAHGTVLGTPAYMPPEQALVRAADDSGTDAVNRSVMGPQADVYGMGAILYEILTGHPPYAVETEGQSVRQFLDTLRTRPPAAVLDQAPDAPAELAAICANAMERRVEDRYPSMSALAEDLRAFTENRVVAAYGANVTTTLRKWILRNRALATTIAAAAVLLLGATIFFVVHLAAARTSEAPAAADARATLGEILDLSVVEQVADLRRRAEGKLWPATGSRIALMGAWLDEAEALRPTLATLRARRDLLPEGAQGSAVGAQGSASDTARSVWRRRLIEDAVASLDAFFAAGNEAPFNPAESTGPPLRSDVAAVAQRLEYARWIGSVDHDRRRRAATLG